MENKTSTAMKKVLFSLAVLFFCAGGAFAQKKGEVIEVKDPEIDALIAKRADLYAMPREEKGYRVELYRGPEREAYIEMRNRYRSLYPDGESHLHYEAPDFSLQIGNCKTLAEAYRLRDKLVKDFESAVVVEAVITVNGR